MLRTRGGRICLSDVIFVTAKKGMTLLLPPPPPHLLLEFVAC